MQAKCLNRLEECERLYVDAATSDSKSRRRRKARHDATYAEVMACTDTAKLAGILMRVNASLYYRRSMAAKKQRLQIERTQDKGESAE